MNALPPLVEKALVDAGYDLISEAVDGWVSAGISGRSSRIRVKIVAQGTVLAVPEPQTAARIGLRTWADAPPAGSGCAGLAATPQDLNRALRLLRTLAAFPVPSLSAEVEARLARIPEKERMREVRERIGQDVYRDALIEFWDGRCALCHIRLPGALLRASHAKPWAKASDDEKLDPFNGLLLAVHFDALFDKGLIAFEDDGRILIAPTLTQETREFLGLNDAMQLRFVLPGHLPYLRYHRDHIARL